MALNTVMTQWFDQHLSIKDKNFPNIVYQDLSPCCELIANVYTLNDKEYKYLVTGGEFKFKVKNMLEVYDRINDISKKYKKYGKCWYLYNKIRKSFDKNEYEFYVSHCENPEIINVIKDNIK